MQKIKKPTILLNKHKNIKNNINVGSESSNNSSNDNNSFLKKYTILNKILDKNKQNTINPSKNSMSIDSQNNSSLIKSSLDNSKSEINVNLR